MKKCYRKAEYCSNSVVHEKFSRDRLVVGASDDSLNDKLQPDVSLLYWLIEICRRDQVSKQAQDIVRPTASSDSNVTDLVKSWIQTSNEVPRARPAQDRNQTSHSNRQTQQAKCYIFGRQPHHNKQDCPPLETKCAHCNTRLHWKVVCWKLFGEVAKISIYSDDTKLRPNNTADGISVLRKVKMDKAFKP